MTPPAPISAERIEEIRRFDIAGEIERTDTILNRMRMSKQERTVLDILKHLVQMRADLLTALDAATAEAARLREALKPFADCAGNLSSQDDDDLRIDVEHPDRMRSSWVTAGDLRRARAALTPTPPAVATVAPEGPSEEAKQVAWIIENLIHAAGKGAEFDKMGDDLAVAIDRLAGRGRA